MTKVFSSRKYLLWPLRTRGIREVVRTMKNKNAWYKEAKGLTHNEMAQRYILAGDRWMKEAKKL